MVVNRFLNVATDSHAPSYRQPENKIGKPSARTHFRRGAEISYTDSG